MAHIIFGTESYTTLTRRRCKLSVKLVYKCTNSRSCIIIKLLTYQYMILSYTVKTIKTLIVTN